MSNNGEIVDLLAALQRSVAAAKEQRAQQSKDAPACECPTDNYCPRCHPRWHAIWRANQSGSVETGLPAITRYFIPESSQARLRINCPNCTSEWGWCIDTPTNQATLEGMVATHVRQGCVMPPPTEADPA